MYKLYDLLSEPQLETMELEELPVMVNWDTLPKALHRRVIIELGERKCVEYYANTDGVIYDPNELIIKVDYTIYRDPNGNAIRRERVRGYARNDGTNIIDYESDPSIKWYNDQEQINEGIIRRRNIVTWLRGQGIGSSLEPLIKQFVKDVELQLVSFIDTHDTTILTTVANHMGTVWVEELQQDVPWMDLDVTGHPGYKIRQYILDNMTI